MKEKELKLKAIVTLDAITDTALDKLLHKKDSSIREYEKSIADSVQNYAAYMKSGERMQDTTSIIENVTGEILDITSAMNHGCFKAGLQTGAQLMLELLQDI